MNCPACGVEMRITGSATVVTGDDSAATPTRVYTRHTLQCRNPACSRKAPVTVDHLLYESAAPTDEGPEAPSGDAASGDVAESPVE